MYKMEYLNISMLLISFIAAYIIPFDVFLFAYAVLGPLHYLTEIRWLHSRDYFVASGVPRYAFIVIITTATLIMVSVLPDPISGTTFIMLFFIAILCVFVRSIYVWISVATLSAALYFFSTYPHIILISVLLPTLIHVYFFTLVFMLQAARKKGILFYFIAPSLHILFGIVCIYSGWAEYAHATQYAGAVFQNSYFTFTNTFMQVGNGFAMSVGSVQELLASPQGIAISRLFAFAYMYHYLNWFIKVHTIGWMQTSRTTIGIIGLLWIAALSIYAYDYILGMTVLAFLSISHVILEFPLNVKSMASFARIQK